MAEDKKGSESEIQRAETLSCEYKDTRSVAVFQVVNPAVLIEKNEFVAPVTSEYGEFQVFSNEKSQKSSKTQGSDVLILNKAKGRVFTTSSDEFSSTDINLENINNVSEEFHLVITPASQPKQEAMEDQNETIFETSAVPSDFIEALDISPQVSLKEMLEPIEQENTEEILRVGPANELMIRDEAMTLPEVSAISSDCTLTEVSLSSEQIEESSLPASLQGFSLEGADFNIDISAEELKGAQTLALARFEGSFAQTILPDVKLDDGVARVSFHRQARYEKLHLIGKGGIGEVLLAFDHDIHRKVALKRLQRELQKPVVIARFIREIRNQGKLEHPNIAPVYDVVCDEDGLYFFVMKYIEGETLEHVISCLKEKDEAYQKRFPLTMRLQIMLELMRAIHFAHEKGIIHRDIKPANIMIGKQGEVTVMDWGLAKNFIEEEKNRKKRTGSTVRTLKNELVGTPEYMSPEQAMGQNDFLNEQTDIYSISVVFLEFVTLRHYLEGKQSVEQVFFGILNEKVLLAHESKREDDLPVSSELSGIISKGMEKILEERWLSLEEMIQKVRTLTEERYQLIEPVAATVEQAITSVSKPMTGLVIKPQHIPARFLRGALSWFEYHIIVAYFLFLFFGIPFLLGCGLMLYFIFVNSEMISSWLMGF